MPVGRPPKPTALKKLDGTAQPCRMRSDEPEPPIATDLSPPDLIANDREALDFWRTYAPRMQSVGLLTEIDIPDFAAGARWWGVFVREGRAGGDMSLSIKAWDKCSGVLSRFGMNPSGRTRVKATAPKSAELSPAEQWKRDNARAAAS